MQEKRDRFFDENASVGYTQLETRGLFVYIAAFHERLEYRSPLFYPKTKTKKLKKGKEPESWDTQNRNSKTIEIYGLGFAKIVSKRQNRAFRRFGFQETLWIFLTKRSLYYRLSLLPSALAWVSGVQLTSWKVMEMTTPARSPRGKRRPPRTSNCRAACGGSPHDDRLNCWDPLKPCVPQHRDETGPNVTVAKAERNAWMAQGANLNAVFNGQSAAKPRTGERSTTIPCGSRAKRPEVVCPVKAGEDIVCAHTKVWGVRLDTRWNRAGRQTGVNKNG